MVSVPAVYTEDLCYKLGAYIHSFGGAFAANTKQVE
jgi:hypothetical protein